MAIYSGRRVYWSDQETIGFFVPSDVNTAGWFDLSTEGLLMCGRASRGNTLLWTTTDLWTMTYIGGTLVYAFERVGSHCGIISPNAAVVLDGGAYWMGIGKFFHFDGYVRPVPCEVTDHVFGNFNQDLATSVWAFANPTFGEVTWFYPSSTATSEDPTDRYVTFNYQENHWSFGTLARSIGITSQAGMAAQTPVLLGADGTIYDHETGNTRDGNAFLESGPMQVGEGDAVMRLQRIVPDDKTLGDVSASLYTSLFPDDAETLHGPYTLASPTSIRLTARQVRLQLVEVVAAAWRVGVVRLGAVLSGRR